ncbi:hypothetical protein QR685DRAFT_30419 [Neurospora intermedia]|uniref:Secreted protein n=1 Tax=Neurospora intermedia TaxID=5142 RepID=A0ABR3DQR2_NEUIN
MRQIYWESLWSSMVGLWCMVGAMRALRPSRSLVAVFEGVLSVAVGDRRCSKLKRWCCRNTAPVVFDCAVAHELKKKEKKEKERMSSGATDRTSLDEHESGTMGCPFSGTGVRQGLSRSSIPCPPQSCEIASRLLRFDPLPDRECFNAKVTSHVGSFSLLARLRRRQTPLLCI